MVAASKRIDTIDEMVSDFVKEKNTQIDKVSSRHSFSVCDCYFVSSMPFYHNIVCGKNAENVVIKYRT